jgi:hypothetical protein
MKPSNYRQRQPADNADRMAADLAADMLSFLANMYEQASTESERLDIILRYGKVMHQLQRIFNKAAQKTRHSYPGNFERKNA